MDHLAKDRACVIASQMLFCLPLDRLGMLGSKVRSVLLRLIFRAWREKSAAIDEKYRSAEGKSDGGADPST
jgi:hypothetical protein